MIVNLLNGKKPPHLKKSINKACHEVGTYVPSVKNFEREMEINGLEADDPLVKTQMTAIKKHKMLKNPREHKMTILKHTKIRSQRTF